MRKVTKRLRHRKYIAYDDDNKRVTIRGKGGSTVSYGENQFLPTIDIDMDSLRHHLDYSSFYFTDSEVKKVHSYIADGDSIMIVNSKGFIRLKIDDFADVWSEVKDFYFEAVDVQKKGVSLDYLDERMTWKKQQALAMVKNQGYTAREIALLTGYTEKYVQDLMRANRKGRV